MAHNSVMAIEVGMADYVLEISEDELAALKETARDADGRKSEVRTAREVLGLR